MIINTPAFTGTHILHLMDQQRSPNLLVFMRRRKGHLMLYSKVPSYRVNINHDRISISIDGLCIFWGKIRGLGDPRYTRN